MANQRNVYKFKDHCGRHRGRNGKIYGPGDLIELYEYETLGFADKLELVSSGPAEGPAVPAPPPPLEIHKIGEGKFNVINPATSLPVNAVPLSEAQARSLAGPSAIMKQPEPAAAAESPAPAEQKRARKAPPEVAAHKLTPVHKGAGRYVVLDETTGEIIAGGDGKYLNKAQATARAGAGK